MEMAIEDIQQLFKHSVVLHKTKPVFVDQVGADGNLTLTDIMSSRTKLVPFKMDDFAAPALRLGFINYGGSVVYAVRNPIRRYKVGYSHENTAFHSIDCYYPLGKGATKERVANLKCPELGDALFNVYPTFSEAIKYVLENKGAMAFDKQFCVTSDRKVFYKTSFVGTFAKTAKTIKDITWQKGSEHLTILLEGKA